MNEHPQPGLHVEGAPSVEDTGAYEPLESWMSPFVPSHSHHVDVAMEHEGRLFGAAAEMDDQVGTVAHLFHGHHVRTGRLDERREISLGFFLVSGGFTVGNPTSRRAVSEADGIVRKRTESFSCKHWASTLHGAPRIGRTVAPDPGVDRS